MIKNSVKLISFFYRYMPTKNVRYARMAFNEKTGRFSVYKGTRVVKVSPLKPDMDIIRFAAKIIKKGGLVAFPTETVYGLGADAFNSEAVMKVFEVKERPADNPIIVHVSSKAQVCMLAKEVPEEAERLMDAFWPGPLTVVLRKVDRLPGVVTAGLDTVAVRMPNHKVALALIEEAETPIAAPSANLAGKPSPTTAQHVIDDLAGRIDMILDAGPTRIGVESTVVDVTSSPPQILRPGGTPYEKIKEVLGEVKLHPVAVADRPTSVAEARSPGMKHRHYAPNAQLIVVEGEIKNVIAKILEIANSHLKEGKKVGILTTDETKDAYNVGIVKSLGSRRNLSSIAKNLFKLLREFDEEKVDIIIAEGVPLKDLGLAVMNRLRKASGFNIVKA